MATQKKVDTVNDIVSKLEKAKAWVLADYHGIKHLDLELLRKKLKEVGAEFTITKNRLFKRALDETKKQIDEKELEGSTAALFMYEDEVLPVKELVKFLKSVGVGQVKAGLMGETQMSADEVLRLSKLPSRDQILSQLVGQLNAPLSGLHNALSWNIRKLGWTLNAVKDSKE